MNLTNNLVEPEAQSTLLLAHIRSHDLISSSGHLADIESLAGIATPRPASPYEPQARAPAEDTGHLGDASMSDHESDAFSHLFQSDAPWQSPSPRAVDANLPSNYLILNPHDHTELPSDPDWHVQPFDPELPLPKHPWAGD